MTTTQPTAEQLEVTHYCVVCAARWRRNEDGTWTLASKECGPCCDNAPMGDQIVPFNADGTLDGKVCDEARRKVDAKRRRDEIARYGGIECQLCGEPFERHEMNWSCRKRVRPRFKFPATIQATEARIAALEEALRETIDVAEAWAEDDAWGDNIRGRSFRASLEAARKALGKGSE